MVKRPTTVSEDRRNADALADPARIAERMKAYTDSLESYAGPFDRYLDWPTFALAVIGAIVAICAIGFLVLPGVIVGMGNLIAFSLKFWGVT